MISARCPEVVDDDRGRPGVCGEDAVVLDTRLQMVATAEGTRCELWARIRCDAGHPLTVLWEDLDLLG